MRTSIARMLGAIWVVVLGVSGCAFNLTDVTYSPAQLQPLPPQSRSFVLTKAVQISHAPCGYDRTLRQQTRWDCEENALASPRFSSVVVTVRRHDHSVGSITEGEVFRSRDQVLTVECSNVFEAYLVVSGDRLVGFYLPVQKGFVALSPPLDLPLAW
jgi:hypothetical protein